MLFRPISHRVITLINASLYNLYIHLFSFHMRHVSVANLRLHPVSIAMSPVGLSNIFANKNMMDLPKQDYFSDSLG